MILNTEAQYCIIEREFIQGNYRFKQTFLQIKLLACNNAGTYTCSVTDGGSVAVQHTVNLYLRSKFNFGMELEKLCTNIELENSV